MEYYIRGKNKISLSQNDFIAKGGQAQIFGKGNIAYKVYIDSSSILPDGKMRELGNVDHPNIIIPKDTLLDKQNKRCGYTMKWIKNTVPLCKLFTNDFRSRNGIVNDLVINLVDNIRCMIVYLHRRKCLIVDGNEFNYIVNDNDFSCAYCIDTDSYQTRTYPATAIMPSIKDYHSNEFNELTDWFSFAIIACQLFLGIHPFKGKHPKYNAGELEKRMINNVSIFNKETILPRIVRDFSLIPKNYYDWFIALFEEGKRLPAPDIAGGLTVIMKQLNAINMQGCLNISLIKKFDEGIIYHGFKQGIEIVKIKTKIHIENKIYDASLNEEVLLTSKKSIPVMCDIKSEKLILRCLSNHIISNVIDIACTDKMVIDNTLYLKNGSNLIEVMFNDMGPLIIVSVKNVWSIMEHSSTFYSSTVYQNVLGRPYLVIPLPSTSGASKCFYCFIEALKEYKIIDAKYSKGVCCVIGFKDSQYDKITLRFNENHLKHDCRIISDITYMDINFVVKDNGVVVMINDENNIEIFRSTPFDKDINKIENISLPLPLKLSCDGNSVLFFKNENLNRINLK